MGRLQNQPGIGRSRRGLCLFLRLRPPEDKGDGLGQPDERCDDPIGELLPSKVFVAVGLAPLHGENRVQKQHTLLRPVGQISVPAGRNSQIRLPLLVDVNQRRRQLHPRAHRESQSVGLPRLVVGVLAQNHRPDLLRRRQGKG